MKKSRVYLITNDKSIEEFMSINLVPLREMDSYSCINYEQGLEDIGNPDVILVYCGKDEKDKCLELIHYLRCDKNLYAASIILILDKFEKDFIIKAYAEEITDYILKSSEKGSTLVKLMWAFRQNACIKELKKRKSLLTDFGIIDKKTGLYASAHREKIYNHELSYLDMDSSNTIMLIGASDSNKNCFNYDEFVHAVRISLRSSDFVFQGLNEKIYVILPETPLNVVDRVFEKIKNNLKNPEAVVAAAVNIANNKFIDVENTLHATLLKADATKKKIICINCITTYNEADLQDESWQDWVNENLGTQKNFKIFKAAYKKKKDTIIVPTFFQLQKLYEDKFFEVDVQQEIGENTCKFILRKNDNEGEFQINYNGFSKININVVYSGLDSPENQKFEIDLSKITEKYITKLIKNFIKSFVDFYS